MKLPVKMTFFAALVAVVLSCTAAASAGDHYNKRGNILIADQFNNRVPEVDPLTNEIVWSFGDGSSTARTTSVVAPKYVTNTRPGSVANPQPTRAVRLMDGNALISDQFNDQVIKVDGSGNIVFSQGQIGVAGTGFNELNAPYDAKVVGDYTGLTAP
jgi:hypothetical protein